MDLLQILQTVGIYVGAVALVAIAIMLFLVLSSFLPGADEPDEEELPQVLRRITHGESGRTWTLPVQEPRRRGRPRSKKARPDAGDKSS